MQEFFLEVREVDRDNEVNRILGAFKLNPFEQMGLRFDATHEEAKRQYRKVSLMIHPDKCKHPLATSAFEVLGNANQQLQNEEAVRELRHVLNLARGTCRAPGLPLPVCRTPPALITVRICSEGPALPVCADEVRKERKKSTKNDAVVRLASVIHEVSSAACQPMLR